MILTPQHCVSVFARTAWTTIAAVAATITVAPEAALAVATETAATVVAIAVAIGLAHHRRGTFLVSSTRTVR